MNAYLQKHGSGFAGHSIKVNWKRDGKTLTVNFSVQKRFNKEWITDPLFTEDWRKNWGLWNKDVVEAFLQLRENEKDITAPYLEIQVSPLNQPFALIITEPRKTFYPPEVLTFSAEVSVDKKNWDCNILITLPSDLKGEKLYGGFFSCLEHNPREYYALEPNKEVNPDFHRPELFLPLDET